MATVPALAGGPVSAYYNEHDPFAAAWLRELIKAGLIPAGDVDERSILDVWPADLDGYTQCHFFAGIGVWAYALRRAGWPDDQAVWTGSCPCQPYSAAGKGGGFDDERHLWPYWFHLIEVRRPPVIYGEQVAAKAALEWLDLVHADLEGAGYAFGSADLCAAGLGAPHIRQRLYWVAQSEGEQYYGSGDTRRGRRELTDSSAVCELANNDSAGQRAYAGAGLHHEEHNTEPCSELGNPNDAGPQGRSVPAAAVGSGDSHSGFITWPTSPADTHTQRLADSSLPERRALTEHRTDDQHEIEIRPEGASDAGERGEPRATNGFWSGADWLPCIDGKTRPVEPGTFPLAHGAPARVGRLRGYGNAIVAPCAQAFIETTLGR